MSFRDSFMSKEGLKKREKLDLGMVLITLKLKVTAKTILMTF